MLTTTVPDTPDIHTGPLLVVRTSICEATVDELRDTIVAVFANQPHESLRDQQAHPELVLQAVRVDNMAEAETIAARLRHQHADKVPDKQRVKIIRLADASPAELAAIERITGSGEPDLGAVFANLVPDLPIKMAGLLAAKLHEAGYRVIAPVASGAGVR